MKDMFMSRVRLSSLLIEISGSCVNRSVDCLFLLNSTYVTRRHPFEDIIFCYFDSKNNINIKKKKKIIVIIVRSSNI
ncbi:Hypothetical protein SRAE_2000202700 [Strongyloides ratti]|uniref:Uncharacterized protein n=1 Tax=Strongyloides ratti TaxID=34506 RepID=A0A090LGV6_STRRB|nr:Hypothetical protein SRAE_2000202700 [Strongyloides ratti]CEF67363.1 Hypothetical protein SRAE_2000202700 [Strongyloides ratti]